MPRGHSCLGPFKRVLVRIPRQNQQPRQPPSRQAAKSLPRARCEHRFIDQRNIDSVVSEKSKGCIEAGELAGNRHVLLTVDDDAPAQPFQLRRDRRWRRGPARRRMRADERCYSARTGSTSGNLDPRLERALRLCFSVPPILTLRRSSAIRRKSDSRQTIFAFNESTAQEVICKSSGAQDRLR